MTCCANKKIIDIKRNIIIIHSILSGIIVCCAIPLFLNDIKIHTILSIIILSSLIAKIIFNYYVIQRKLQANNTDFLRYMFCKKCCKEEPKVGALLNNVFQSTTDLISFKDTNFRYIMCSERFIKMMNLQHYNIIGKTQYEVFPNSEAKRVHEILKKVLKTKSAITFTQKLIQDNKESMYESTASPIICNNEIVGILTLSRDITETLNSKKSLENSYSQVCELLNSMPLIAYILDRNGNLMFGNIHAKKLFEKGIDELYIGKSIQYDTNYLREHVIKENKEIFMKGETVSIEKELESINGDKYWYISTKTPLKNENGEYYAMTTFVRNIDAERRMKEQTETYIATLSHDLKTPAVAQARVLDLLLSGQMGELTKEQRELIELTFNSCNYLYQMVCSLLSTYKFENGEMILQYSTFNLNSVISECIEDMSRQAKTRNINIEISTNDEDYSITADISEIKRVINNFLLNFIAYAFQDSTIRIYLCKINNQLEMRITSSSPYMSPENIKRIFEKNATHAEKYNKVGIGLGLYLSKQIIQAHKGILISESSAKDNTNTIGFILPTNPMNTGIKNLVENTL